MKSAAEDLERRRPVWSALSNLYLDSSYPGEVRFVARQLAASAYAIEELRQILFDEVHPVLCGNLLAPVGVWDCFDQDELERRILLNRRRPRWLRARGRCLRRYALLQWRLLEPRIDKLRKANADSTQPLSPNPALPLEGAGPGIANMHIETQGSGPDLVLIHGWAMHGGIFAPLLERLTPRFRVHLVDLPGHGYSRDETRFDVVDAAQRIAQATPRAAWIGWSLGGLVALRAALDHAEQVRGLVAIASSPRFVAAPDWPQGVPMEVFTAFGVDLETHYREAIERFLALETLGAANAQAELRELKQQVFERGEPAIAALQDGLRALETNDLRGDLPRLRVPSLWIAGRRDRLVAPAAMQWAAQQAPSASCLELNSGHAPFIGHADEVAAAIERFAAELPA